MCSHFSASDFSALSLPEPASACGGDNAPDSYYNELIVDRMKMLTHKGAAEQKKISNIDYFPQHTN